MHLARDPERSRAVAEAVVDARLPGACMQGVGLLRRSVAGGVWRRVCAWKSAKPLRAPATEAARRPARLYLSGEAALLLGGRARVARAHILRHVAHDAASEPPHRTLVSLLARLVQLQ